MSPFSPAANALTLSPVVPVRPFVTSPLWPRHPPFVAFARRPGSAPPLYLQATGGATAVRVRADDRHLAPAARWGLLDRAGLAAPLDKAHINIYGHVEGSYTYNFDNPRSGQNPFRLFDFEDEKLLMNQLDLTIERRVDYRNAKLRRRRSRSS